MTTVRPVGATCPGCGANVDAASRFCADCGAALGRRCPACGEPADAAKRFCANCGAALATRGGDAGPGRAGGRAQAGHGALLRHRRLDVDRRADRAPRRCTRCSAGSSDLALEELRFYGGTIDRFLGDGFMALIGVPTAHEDHARRAVLAALALRRRLLRDLTPPGARAGRGADGAQQRLGRGRAASATIPRATTRRSATRSTSPPACSRIAEPGTILISDATARQVAGYVPLRARSAPWRSAAGPSRRRAPRAGARAATLAARGPRPAAQRTFRRPRAPARRPSGAAGARPPAGRGQVVGVVAEPGMGKSRLVSEFRRCLAGERLTVLEGRCLSYGSRRPLRPAGSTSCAPTAASPTATRPPRSRPRPRFGLAEVGIDPGPRVPLLLRMMGAAARHGAPDDLSPEAVKQRTFETLLTDVPHRQPPPADALRGRGPPLDRRPLRGVSRPAGREHPGRPDRSRLHLSPGVPGPLDAARPTRPSSRCRG